MVQHQPSINPNMIGGVMSHHNQHHHIDTSGMIGWNMMQWIDPASVTASGLIDSNSDRVMHPTRGRSPGAHPHFHPYKTGNNLPYPTKDRVPPLEYHQYPGVMHGNLLQPPDIQWRK